MSSISTISIAESLTGGSISSSLVNISGISKIYKGGITVYSLESKIRLLNIPENKVNESNGISQFVSEEMAKNVCNLFNTNIGLSTTGYAEKYEENNTCAYISLYTKLSNSDEKITTIFLEESTREDDLIIIKMTDLSDKTISYQTCENNRNKFRELVNDIAIKMLGPYIYTFIQTISDETGSTKI